MDVSRVFLQPLGRVSRPCQAPPLAAERSSFWPNVLTGDLVVANRAPEKKLSVVPSLDLVVTRLGKLPGPGNPADLSNRVLEAAEAPAPRPPENRSAASSEHRNTR
jgi:hypothetical protein